jgi:hypothetical protein
MIHHLARAFFFRSNAEPAAAPAQGDDPRPATAPSPRPVKAKPVTPWSTAPRPSYSGTTCAVARATLHGAGTSAQEHRRVRISSDPSDARRTVIAGRFAEVCAALDRMVLEQEAAA